MTATLEARLHKRRQRARNQDRKQGALDELLERVLPLDTSLLAADSKNADTSTSTSTSLADLYQPIIPSLSLVVDFWKQVPDICNPNAAVLNAEISDPTKLAGDKYQQSKYERKLELKQERGEITEQERRDLWEQHGRSGSSTASTGTSVTWLSANRGQRKAWQVENFVTLLQDKLLRGSTKDNNNNNLTVVDFGSGSGNLCLALAAYFTHVRFVLVDKKPYPLTLVQRRAEEAGLTNVQVLQYTFSPGNLKDFEPPPPPEEDERITTTNPSLLLQSFDIGIGLHCCGSFTDMVMEICRDRGADCIVCPCCNGAMTSKTTCGYNYPRSEFLKCCMTQDEYLGQLSKSADDLGNYPAKCLVEYDRAMWAKENGFRHVELWKLTPVECTPKHHVLYLKN
jgi:SAM-dependent methyltransferase